MRWEDENELSESDDLEMRDYGLFQSYVPILS
jgi:hypothetical protein